MKKTLFAYEFYQELKKFPWPNLYSENVQSKKAADAKLIKLYEKCKYHPKLQEIFIKWQEWATQYNQPPPELTDFMTEPELDDFKKLEALTIKNEINPEKQIKSIKFDDKFNVKRKAIIFDIDGTLCDDAHRKDYVKIDWQEYHSRAIGDPPFQLTCQIARNLKKEGYQILLLTGRDEKYRKDAERWMYQNDIKFDQLYMRPDNDHIPSAVLKMRIYYNEIDPFYDVSAVFEDRDKVVEMWRSIGLLCYQTQEGNY